jgi:Ni,Fe-hydrogenase III small subunit
MTPGGLKQNVPVAAFVPGCPPKPEAILQGIVTALKKLK